MDLMTYLPAYYSNSDEVIEMQKSFGCQNDLLQTDLKDLLNQLFVDTATWGLERWEKYLEIKTDTNKDKDYRRSVIKSKLRGHGTATKALIKNVSESYINGAVEVIEDNKNYKIKIKFVGVKGIPPNLNDLKKSIEEIKPAHLEVLYEITHNLYSELEPYKYDRFKTMKYIQVRDEVIK